MAGEITWLIPIFEVIIAAFAVGFLIWFLRHFYKTVSPDRFHKIAIAVFVLYLAGIFILTIGIREPGDEVKINLIPLNTEFKMIYQVVNSANTWLGWRFYREFMYMTENIRNLFGNILLMIPFGYFLPLIWKERINKWYKVVLFGIGVSVLIEVIQLITLKGFCDIDDVILNGIGCVIGWNIYRRLFKNKV